MAVPQKRPTPQPSRGAARRAPLPWHFKLMLGAAGVYVAARVVQVLGWLGVSLAQVHLAWGVVVCALNVVVAAWGLLMWRRGRPAIVGFWWLTATAWASVVPQVLLGVWLYAEGHRAPLGWQHYVYGPALLVLAAFGLLERKHMPGREGLLFGVVSLLIALAAARGLWTGLSA